MRLHHLLKFVFSFTLFALVYIHLQMQIVALAYQAKEKEKIIHKLVEQNGDVMYTILSLKSAHNLGEKLLNEGSTMEFADPKNVVEISTKLNIFEADEEEQDDVPAGKKRHTLLSFLPLGQQAQAQPLE